MKRVTFSIPWPFTAVATRDLLAYVFQVALLSYLGFYLLENLQPGFVSNYFDLNIMLWSTIGSGLLTALWPAVVPEARKPRRLGWRQYVGLLLLALVTAGIVWYKIQSIGWLAKIIALLSGLIVFGLGLLVYLDDDTERPDGE